PYTTLFRPQRLLFGQPEPLLDPEGHEVDIRPAVGADGLNVQNEIRNGLSAPDVDCPSERVAARMLKVPRHRHLAREDIGPDHLAIPVPGPIRREDLGGGVEEPGMLARGG